MCVLAYWSALFCVISIDITPTSGTRSGGISNFTRNYKQLNSLELLNNVIRKLLTQTERVFRTKWNKIRVCGHFREDSWNLHTGALERNIIQEEESFVEKEPSRTKTPWQYSYRLQQRILFAFLFLAYISLQNSSRLNFVSWKNATWYVSYFVSPSFSTAIKRPMFRVWFVRNIFQSTCIRIFVSKHIHLPVCSAAQLSKKSNLI